MYFTQLYYSITNIIELIERMADSHLARFAKETFDTYIKSLMYDMKERQNKDADLIEDRNKDSKRGIRSSNATTRVD